MRLNSGAVYELDLLRFDELLTEGGGVRTEAIALYRSDFLADFYLPDSAAFEEWTLA